MTDSANDSMSDTLWFGVDVKITSITWPRVECFADAYLRRRMFKPDIARRFNAMICVFLHTYAFTTKPEAFSCD